MKHNNIVLAEEYFIKSIDIENSISYSYGPPSIQKPTHELYADWLLSQKRTEEAGQQYTLAQKIGPSRLRVLEGIEKTQQVL